uniref:Uncharacterized protein n=1 Tax=Amphiprion percula TaxID=161767 RepID=A0A3P8SXD6_AMPPE
MRLLTAATKMQSQVRQNYHSDCTAAINQMVNMEMVASEQFHVQVLAFILMLFWQISPS